MNTTKQNITAELRRVLPPSYVGKGFEDKGFDVIDLRSFEHGSLGDRLRRLSEPIYWDNRPSVGLEETVEVSPISKFEAALDAIAAAEAAAIEGGGFEFQTADELASADAEASAASMELRAESDDADSDDDDELAEDESEDG